jgi:putative peptidoglycan lipid II flippase
MTSAEPDAVPAAPVHERFARDAVVVTVCTLLSRITGFARVLIAAACLGVDLLGDTYAAANTIPNIIFELVAGGVLQAVLVPTFVAARRDGGDDELGRAAGLIAATLTAFLAAIVVVGIALSPLITRLLVHDAGAVADDKRVLMGRMLLLFVPQIVFYGVGMVATAALAARRHFMAAALAPAVNNVIVITCYLVYRASLDGATPSLDLSAWQFTLLAGGTTLAVVVFTAVPAIVLARSGVPWRLRWDPSSDVVRGVRRAFGWAMLSVAGTLAPTAAAVVLGYDAPGGVAVFTMTFAFFVLPHALVAVPVATTLAPRAADAWQRREHEAVRSLIERSVQVVVPVLLVSGAAMVALAWPIGRLASSFGEADGQGVAPIAHALAVFGCGLVGYGVAFTMTRVLFSLGDVRAASILVTVSAVIGVAGMVVASAVLDASERAAALALGYGITQLVSTVLLTLRVRQLTGAPTWRASGRLGTAALAAAVAAGAAMALVRAPFGTSRSAAVGAVLVAGTAGAAVFVALVAALGGVRPSQLIPRGRRAI